jgi:preprotein translocase subunit SecA
VITIPTNSKNKRKDLENVVYFKESTKWRCIARECCNFYTLGRPILIGTTTIANSEVMSSVLLAYKIPHKVLNARPENVLNETQIIAQAGCKSSITIATNMAGRGTDILLGGNPQFLATFFLKKFFKNDVENSMVQTFIRFLYVQFKKAERIEIKRAIDLITFFIFKSSKFKEELLYEVKNTDDRNFNPYQELYNSVFKAQKLLVTTNYNSVLDLGGLYVIGTELHDSRRIDNQLRGRAGRQGDPGSSQFFLSLEESLLLKEFGGTNVLEQMKKYGRSDLETLLKSTGLTKALKIAQKKIENFYLDERQNLLKYEEVINLQRNKIYEERRFILAKKYSVNGFLDYGKRICDEVFRNFKDFDFVVEKLQKLLGIPFSNCRMQNLLIESVMKYWLHEHVEISYELRKSELEASEPSLINKFETSIMLQQLDIGWSEHLQKVDFLREATQWRAYGQRNPLTEYKSEALQIYTEMLIKNRHKFIFSFMQVRLLI